MKIGIGSAQFGMDYGATNNMGITPIQEVRSILELAQTNQIQYIDTAMAYGKSEEILGEVLPSKPDFRIVTKVPPNISVSEVIGTFESSLRRLRREQVFGLMYHSADDLLGRLGDSLWQTFQKIKASRKVEKIGVSVYDGKQIQAVLQRYPIDLIQLPINAIDQRLIEDGSLALLKKSGVEVHARSIFLQGLLLADPTKLSPFFEPFRSFLGSLQEEFLKNRYSPLEGCLGYVASLREIDVLVCGVEHHGQLMEILKAFHKSKQFNLDISKFSCPIVEMINPVHWPKGVKAF